MRGDPRPGKVIEPGDFKAAFQRFQADQMTDHAAALTYYSLLSLFPALLFAVAVLGVFSGEALITDAADYLKDAGAPAATVDSVTSALESAQSQRGTAITALVIGLVALAQRRVGRVQRGRAGAQPRLARRGGPRLRRSARPTTSAWTLVVLVLANLTFVLIFLGGGLAGDVLGLIGLGRHGRRRVAIVRWPLALLSTMLIYAVVFYAAPNLEVRRWQWITPGAVFGVVTWIVASALFFVYVSNFSSYSATYGAFAAAVILLVWLWLTNVVLLFGAELNAAIDVRRTPGHPGRLRGPDAARSRSPRTRRPRASRRAASSTRATSTAPRGPGSRRRGRGAARRPRASAPRARPAASRRSASASAGTSAWVNVA